MVPRLYIATNGLSVWYSDNLGDELTRTQTSKGMYSGTQAWGLACHPKNTGEVLFSGEALYRGREMGTVEAALSSGLQTARAILTADKIATA